MIRPTLEYLSNIDQEVYYFGLHISWSLFINTFFMEYVVFSFNKKDLFQQISHIDIQVNKFI